jgi:large subunit ribosomal protein L19e
MKLKIQKRLAADILKCSESRIRFDEERLDEIKESITKIDIKSLIKDKAIFSLPKKGVSRVRARKIQIQKSKGKKKGTGKRKGKKTARAPRKQTWINKIRAQRILIKNLKESEIIDREVYRKLYKKAQGGFFRSRRHIKLYIEEHDLAKTEK